MRQVAGRFRKLLATHLTASTTTFFAAIGLVEGPPAYSSRAASTVPARVRKSFAVKFAPAALRM